MHSVPDSSVSYKLTLVLLNKDMPCFAEEANWSGSALFVNKFIPYG